MSKYPRWNDQHELVWACCESSIGRPCAHERHKESAVAELLLVEAQAMGMVGDDDWQKSTDGAYFLVNFGDGRGVVEYTAAEIVTKLGPESGFFNRSAS